MPAAKKVLVVEDDATTARIIEAMLRGENCELSLSADGKEALERIERECFDLVLTDLALPGVSGLEVIRAVKRKGDCRVVVMSAHWRDSPLVAQAEELGCDAVVGKPFDKRQLVGAVREQLGRCDDANDETASGG